MRFTVATMKDVSVELKPRRPPVAKKGTSYKQVMDQLDTALAEMTSTADQAVPRRTKLHQKDIRGDAKQKARWQKIASPLAEVLRAEGLELFWLRMKLMTKDRPEISGFTPHGGWRSITAKANAVIEVAISGNACHAANANKRRRAKARRIRFSRRTSTARLLR